MQNEPHRHLVPVDQDITDVIEQNRMEPASALIEETIFVCFLRPRFLRHQIRPGLLFQSTFFEFLPPSFFQPQNFGGKDGNSNEKSWRGQAGTERSTCPRRQLLQIRCPYNTYKRQFQNTRKNYGHKTI
jgi:hypothetical protein